MAQDITGLFESVIRITQERDKRSLEKALVETLVDFVEFEAIILLRIPRGRADLMEAAAIPSNARQDRLELLTQRPGEARIKRDEALDRCIEGCEIVFDVLGGEIRTLFPVGTKGNVSAILAVYGRACTDGSVTFIRGFLRIYGNFVAVLDDNEHDTLTGLLNRKTFDMRISELISGSQKSAVVADGAERRAPSDANSHWLGILDIDHFKRINDRFGHVYGDEVLILFSDLMKTVFRSTDLLFRYGGEEFVVVLAPASEASAFLAFERFRRQLESFEFPQVGLTTASIGMTSLSTEEHPATVVEHADKALYFAKENGRNQTRNYRQLIMAGLLKEQRYAGEIELF